MARGQEGPDDTGVSLGWIYLNPSHLLCKPQNCLNSKGMFPHPLHFHNQHLLNISRRIFFSLKVQPMISLSLVTSGISFCSGESALFKLSGGERWQGLMKSSRHFFPAGSWAGEGTWRWFLSPQSAPWPPSYILSPALLQSCYILTSPQRQGPLRPLAGPLKRVPRSDAINHSDATQTHTWGFLAQLGAASPPCHKGMNLLIFSLWLG